MKARRRFRPLAVITLSSALLAACVQSADDSAQLSADHALDQRSRQGLVEATVSLASHEIARGPNDFSISLRAAQGPSLPVLTSVQASMAAHGHQVSAARIISDGSSFRAVDLDLFMSGRWQVALAVELEASSDLIEFAIDVP
ncbi:MAG TPA: hypothetical protein VGC79_20045 [Polyangiaceae bacterium]